MLNFRWSTSTCREIISLRALQQPVNTPSCPNRYLLFFPPPPDEAHPCKSDYFFFFFSAPIWRCCYDRLSLCGQVEALSPFPAEMGFIYRPLLLGLTAAVIVGQVLRVTHLSGDTMIHGSNSIPRTVSRYVSARAVWVSGDGDSLRALQFQPQVRFASDRIELQIKFDERFHFFFFNFLHCFYFILGPRRPLINI